MCRVPWEIQEICRSVVSVIYCPAYRFVKRQVM
jgi:hypothetical protein